MRDEVCFYQSYVNHGAIQYMLSGRSKSTDYPGGTLGGKLWSREQWQLLALVMLPQSACSAACAALSQEIMVEETGKVPAARVSQQEGVRQPAFVASCRLPSSVGQAEPSHAGSHVQVAALEPRAVAG